MFQNLSEENTIPLFVAYVLCINIFSEINEIQCIFPQQIEFNEGETLTLLDNGKQGKWLVCLNPFNF